MFVTDGEMFKSRLEFELVKSLTQNDDESIKDTEDTNDLPNEQSSQPLVIGEIQSEEVDENSTSCMNCSHFMPHTNLCGKFIRKLDSPYEPLCNLARDKDTLSV
jgi:hypothetical protein